MSLRRYLICFSVLILLMIVRCTPSSNEAYDKLKIENQALKDSLAQYHAQENSLTNRLEDVEIQMRDTINALCNNIYTMQREHDILYKTNNATKPSEWISDYDIKYLKEKGFKNPQKEILENLYRNKALFAEDGILGGTMRIFSATMIGTSYVLAAGEDGHIGYYYLLKYTVNENKSITWDILYKADLFN